MKRRRRLTLTGAAALAAVAFALSFGANEVIASSIPSDQSAAQPLSSQPVEIETQGFNRSDMMALALAVVALALVVLTGWYDLRRAPRRPFMLQPLSAVFLLGLIYLLAPVGMSIAMLLFGIRQPEGDPPPPMPFKDTVILHTAAMTARLVGVWVFFTLARRSTPPASDRRFSISGSIVVALAGLLVVWPMVLAAVAIVRWLTSASDDPIAHETLRMLIDEPLGVWSILMLIAVVAVGPLIEEVMYRGLLQELLGRAGARPWTAIAITSVVFALAHVQAVPPHGLAGLFVLSLAFGWAYERTGRLWAPFAMHAAYNAGNVLLAHWLA